MTQHAEEFSLVLGGRWAMTTLSGDMGARAGFGHTARKHDLLICTAELLQMALNSTEEEEHMELTGGPRPWGRTPGPSPARAFGARQSAAGRPGAGPFLKRASVYSSIIWSQIPHLALLLWGCGGLTWQDPRAGVTEGKAPHVT